jgi:hypothetical protein
VIRLELAPLGAVVVGEEPEPVWTEPLEQDHPRVGRAVGIDRREGHRLGQRDLPLGELEPLAELLDRVVSDSLAVERGIFRAAWAHLGPIRKKSAEIGPFGMKGCRPSRSARPVKRDNR